MKKIAIVSASLSESSSTDQLGQKIGEEVVAALGGPNEAELVMVSLRALAHSITDGLLTGFANPELEAAFEVVDSADGVIAVTPAYNAGMSGLFKSFFDVMPQDTIAEKPVIIGATGGTPRHSLVTEHSIRPMFVYLHAHVTPTSIFAATEDWGAHAKDSDGSGGVAVGPRTERAAREMAQIIAAQRGEINDVGGESRAVGAGDDTGQGTPPASSRKKNSELTAASQGDLQEMDPTELFSDFTSFEDLLGGNK